MKRNKWKAALFLFFSALILMAGSMEAGAEEKEGGAEISGQAADLKETARDMGIENELEGIQQFLDDVMGQQKNPAENISFWDLLKGLAEGNLKEILGQAGIGIRNVLFLEVGQGGKLLAQVAAIGFVGAVFSNVSSVFKGGQVSDTGFFVTYLLLFTCLAGSFLASLEIAAQVLNQVLEFMRVLMPAYFMAVAFSGGSISALALYEVMMAAITLVQWLCSGILLSMVKIYVLMVLGSHVTKEPFLSRLTELLGQGVGWSLKTLVGLVTGFHLIQSMILPYADAAGQTGFKRVIEIIPGFGQGAGAMAQIVLGSGVLMKNSIGASAVVILILIALIPLLKLMILTVLYQCVAAVMQPVCDKRMVSCVDGVARGHKLLVQIVLYSLFLFMLSIAITCASTNVNFFAA